MASLVDGIMLDKSNNHLYFHNVDSITRKMIEWSAIEQITISGNTRTLNADLFMDLTNLKRVIIHKGMYNITIPPNAFCDCVSLTHVELPSSVVSIGHYAFIGCISLTHLVLPDTIQHIGDSAFARCTSLRQINIPPLVSTISERLFEGCSALTTISLPNTVDYIEECAFKNCTSIQQINVPSTIHTIDKGVFKNCTSLVEITLPPTVYTIHDSAFSGCIALSTCQLPTTLRRIEEYAFSNCSSLSHIDIPTGVRYIGCGAFRNCLISSIEFPSAITILRPNTCNNCNKLEHVVLPEKLSTIPTNMFDGCTSLRYINIPDSVYTIGAQAFSGCTSLRTVIINNVDTRINDSAFQNCPNLIWQHNWTRKTTLPMITQSQNDDDDIPRKRVLTVILAEITHDFTGITLSHRPLPCPESAIRYSIGRNTMTYVLRQWNIETIVNILLTYKRLQYEYSLPEEIMEMIIHCALAGETDEESHYRKTNPIAITRY